MDKYYVWLFNEKDADSKDYSTAQFVKLVNGNEFRIFDKFRKVWEDDYFYGDTMMAFYDDLDEQSKTVQEVTKDIIENLINNLDND